MNYQTRKRLVSILIGIACIFNLLPFDNLYLPVYAVTQSSSKYPTNATDVGSSTIQGGLCTSGWSNPTNIELNDGNSASSTACPSGGNHGASSSLRASNFGFNIPVASTINGFNVTIQFTYQVCSSGHIVDDVYAQLEKADVLSGSSEAFVPAGECGSGQNDHYTLGNSADKWGTSYTYSDVNNAKFGLDYEEYYHGTCACSTDTTNWVNLTVYYTLPPTPNDPTTLKPNRISSTKITLLLQGIGAHTTYFKIDQESPKGNGFSTVIANTTNATGSYDFLNLSKGTQYGYRGFAGNGSGTNTTASVSAYNYTGQDPPTSLVASLITKSSERTTFAGATGNLSSYKIEHATGTCASYSTDTSDTGNTTAKYDLTGLSSDTKICERISTFYAKGSSSQAYSSPSTVLTFYTLPASPTGLSVSQIVSRQPHLIWSDAGDNGTATGYFIEYSTNGGSTWNTLATTSNSTTKYDHVGATAGLTYTYRVSAIKYGGTSLPSSTASKLVWQSITLSIFENDGSTKFNCSILQSNSSSSNNFFSCISGTSIINGLSGLQNFTVKDIKSGLLVKKSYNFNATSSNSVSLNANMYLVDCAENGIGNDFLVAVNESNYHRISSTSVPKCSSTSAISLNQTNTANGKSSAVGTSSIFISVLDNHYNSNPTSFLVNGSAVGTSLLNGNITSSLFNIGQGTKTYFMQYLIQMICTSCTAGTGGTGGGGVSSGGDIGGTTKIITSTTPLSLSLTDSSLKLQITETQTGKIGISWNNNQPITISQITVDDSPFIIVFPQQPFNLTSTGSVSNNFITYNLKVPDNYCTTVIKQNCVEKIIYTVPVHITLTQGNGDVVQTANIVADLKNDNTSGLLTTFAFAGVGLAGMVGVGLHLNRKNSGRGKSFKDKKDSGFFSKYHKGSGHSGSSIASKIKKYG